MNILQITNAFYPMIGGQEKVVLELSSRLVNLGHKVTVLTSDYGSSTKLKSSEEYRGIRIIRFRNTQWFGGYGYAPDALSWLKEHYHEFDVVHSHGYNRYLPEFSLKFLHNKKPVVFSPHGFIHTKKNLLFKKIHDFLIGPWLRLASCCTALTKLDIPYYEKLGVTKKKIFLLPNGVDTDMFSREKNNVFVGIKKRFGLPENFLLFVGRIHQSKGLSFVLDMLKEVDTSLVIVGDDAGYKQVLVDKIRRDGLSKKVFFTGSLSNEELVSLYKHAKVFVLTSEWEGFGIVVLEAMAAGLPVIVSDRGSLPLLVKNGKNGLVVPYGNVPLLNKAVISLLNNKGLHTRLKRNGLTFSKNYSWDAITKKTEKLYQRLVNHEF